jgi:hypothetical protein
MTFDQLLQDPARKDRVILDCVRLIEEEVARKSGLTGVVLRGGFSAFQRLQPGIVRLAVDRLLPELWRTLEPHWVATRGKPEVAFSARSAVIADELLSVTDRLAERARNAMVVRLYRSLRPAAHGHVAEAVPRLGELMGRHLS